MKSELKRCAAWPRATGSPTRTCSAARGGTRPARAGLLVLGLGAFAVVLGGCAAAKASSPPSKPVSAATTSVPPTSTTHPTVPTRPRPKPKPTTTTSLGATVGTVDAGPPPMSAPPPLAGAVTMVGDSVGVDTQPYVEQDIPGVHVYAAVDRSWGAGESILQTLASEHALGSVVVVELGLNGPIEAADFQSMMSILSGVRRVVFLNIRLPVNAYGPGTDWWQNQNNTVIADGVRHYHDAVLADWYDYSAGHPSWYAPDGIHLQPAGGAAMAQLIKSYV